MILTLYDDVMTLLFSYLMIHKWTEKIRTLRVHHHLKLVKSFRKVQR